MSNANQIVQMTNAERYRLKNKAKQGWKCYYIEREYVEHLQVQRNTMRQEVLRLRANNEERDYDHLKQMFLELYDKVGQLCDCPVCFETLTKEVTSVPLCGHLVCKPCKEKMTCCPVCRKKY